MADVMSITTKLGANKLLVLRLEGRESLGSLPEWQVDLVGNVSLLGVRESINLHSLLGSRANVTIEHGAKRHFNGFITEAQRGERHGRFDAPCDPGPGSPPSRATPRCSRTRASRTSSPPC
jgi:type VI secretion system secreted protein VgrG